MQIARVGRGNLYRCRVEWKAGGGFEYRQQGRISRKRKGRRLKQFSHGFGR